MSLSRGVGLTGRVYVVANNVTAQPCFAYFGIIKKIGVSAQAVSKARNTGKLPVSWIPKFAHQYKASTDRLFFGCDSSPEIFTKTLKNTPLQPTADKNDIQYAELKIELEEERRERRELAAENRRIWKENSEL